jgi:hypothetical protein
MSGTVHEPMAFSRVCRDTINTNWATGAEGVAEQDAAEDAAADAVDAVDAVDADEDLVAVRCLRRFAWRWLRWLRWLRSLRWRPWLGSSSASKNAEDATTPYLGTGSVCVSCALAPVFSAMTAV